MKYIPILLLCIVVIFFFKKRFFDKTDYKSLLLKGAIIVDVRSESEFYSGSIEKSINIPLGNLPNKLDFLQDKNQGVVQLNSY